MIINFQILSISRNLKIIYLLKIARPNRLAILFLGCLENDYPRRNQLQRSFDQVTLPYNADAGIGFDLSCHPQIST